MVITDGTVITRANSPDAYLGGADSDWLEIRADVILTNSYVVSKTIDIANCSNILLHIRFTIGSLTTGELELVFGDDPEDIMSTLHHIDFTGAAVSPIFNSTITLPNGANLTGCISIPNPGARRFRVKAKGTGTLTSSLLRLLVMRGNTGPIAWNAGS